MLAESGPKNFIRAEKELEKMRARYEELKQEEAAETEINYIKNKATRVRGDLKDQ
ncbi:hypothetical protein [Candidatus Ichthyocystis sparus]|uniref:hypothetical protein n=1 Tax=Candidatus Ichthyocystis sparus TaxID=1561004 RepID=UPI00159EDF8C|nr:hypothetical protein [Candidatus Ichthyocystis sparus]